MAFEHVADISLKWWREYMWSEINVLPNSRKILGLTNRDVFQANDSRMNGNLG